MGSAGPRQKDPLTGASMTGPAADAEPGTLGGGDAVSRLVQAGDGVELHCLRWNGGAPPRAAVIFLPGIASHGGWFAETAADLASAGVAVYAPDRRGSGRSGGPRGRPDPHDPPPHHLHQGGGAAPAL